MKQFKGYEEAKAAAQATGRLPEGAYVCMIIGAKYIASTDSAKNDSIELYFDICEGEQTNFFKNQFNVNTSEDKKWKGKTYIYVPLDDGTERDGWTKNTFAKWTDSIEKSNDGYIWDWDESKWAKKKVGIVFGSTGTVLGGKNIVYTEARFPVDVETVRSGKAPKAKFKEKNGYSANKSSASDIASEPWMQVSDDPAGLPFPE